MVRAAAVTFVVALTLRLIVLVQLQDAPLFRTPQLDALEYVEWGARLAEGDFTWPPTPIHGPGYPFLIGSVLAATESLFALRVVQAVLGSIAAVLVLAIARRLYGDTAGVAAGLLHAAYAPLILTDVSILAEGLLVFLLTLTLWLIVKLAAGDARLPLVTIAVAGLVLGTAIIVRPTAAALLPLLAWMTFRAARRRSVALAVLTAAIALPIVPVMLQNRHAPDRVSGIQASAGMNIYIGNSPLHDGTAWARPGGRWDATRGMAWREGVRGAKPEDRFFIRRTLSEIGADPAGFARVLGSKFLWLTQNEELRDTHSFHFFAAAAPLLRWLPRFGVVLALAICGVVAAVRARRAAWPVAAFAVLLAATFVLLVAGSRYRLPIMPALFVYAGAGVAAAVEALAARKTRTVMLLAAVFAGVILLSHVRTHVESHDFSEELAMSAIALMKEGDLDAAAATARRALSVNAERDAAWVAAGDIEATRGRWEEARHAWMRAIEADRNNARAWSHLGLSRIREGDFRGAEEALQRALAIRADEEALYNLHTLRREQGR